MNVFKSRRPYVLVTLVVFLANFLADRLTKILAKNLLKDREPIELLHNTIMILYTENQGAFLSAGADWNVHVKYAVLIAIPVLLCALILYHVIFKETCMNRIVILSCIAGGGVGNLVDRLFGDFRVVDFMNFGIGSIRTGVLNAADLSVTFGAIAFFFHAMGPRKKEKPAS